MLHNPLYTIVPQFVSLLNIANIHTSFFFFPSWCFSKSDVQEASQSSSWSAASENVHHICGLAATQPHGEELSMA